MQAHSWRMGCIDQTQMPEIQQSILWNRNIQSTGGYSGAVLAVGHGVEAHAAGEEEGVGFCDFYAGQSVSFLCLATACPTVTRKR